MDIFKETPSAPVLPRIEALFKGGGHILHERYFELVPLTLAQILPRTLFTSLGTTHEERDEQQRRFQELLPIMKHSELKEAPFSLSFFLVCRYRPNAFKFFFEMVSRWLVPGKRLNVLLIHAIDFRMPDLGNDVYTLCEVMVDVESKEDADILQRNLPIIETETRLGVASAYFSRKILEIKGLKPDESTASIQEHIAYLIKRMPKEFDIDIFTEMQHVLVKCRDEFKAIRDPRHLSRIISVQYLFRRALTKAVGEMPTRRHFSLKLIKARLRQFSSFKNVLGLIIGVNFLKENEVFEERHILKAIRHHIPQSVAVENSFFQITRGSEGVCTLYLEVAKNDNTDFTPAEILKLRRELPTDLKDRIEHLIHPIFMPRNEEEIMRNIVSLSSQIKFLRDIPQLVLSFDEQTDHHLVFTVILVRILKSGDQAIQKIFYSTETPLEYIHDRVKILGFIRKRYPKEATVFRIKVSKDKFLRSDNSIDLYEARRYVVEEIAKVIGDVRDFNGGMIAKQNELLNTVRNMLVLNGKKHQLLLENLFYSLTPVVMRSVLEPTPLKTLFQMLLEATEEGFLDRDRFLLKAREEGNYLLVMISSDLDNLKEQISHALAGMSIPTSDLATAFVMAYDAPCLGYIYRCQDGLQRRKFLDTIEGILRH